MVFPGQRPTPRSGAGLHMETSRTPRVQRRCGRKGRPREQEPEAPSSESARTSAGALCDAGVGTGVQRN